MKLPRDVDGDTLVAHLIRHWDYEFLVKTEAINGFAHALPQNTLSPSPCTTRYELEPLLSS